MQFSSEAFNLLNLGPFADIYFIFNNIFRFSEGLCSKLVIMNINQYDSQ